MPRSREPDWLVAVLPAMMVLVLLGDIFAPHGYAIYFLYVVPVALTVLGTRPRAPISTAAAAVVSLLLALPFKQDPGALGMVVTRRLLCAVSVGAVALVVRRAIVDRLKVALIDARSAAVGAVLDALRGDLPVEDLARRLLLQLGAAVGAEGGAVWAAGGNDDLELVATEGLVDVPALPRSLGHGPGSEAARLADAGPRVLRGIADGFVRVRTALGEVPARSVLVVPLTLESTTLGVVELARATDDPIEEAMLTGIVDPVARALRSAVDRLRREALLEETQRQSDELIQQQEALRATHEELEEHVGELAASQARLEQHRRELEDANGQLAAHAAALESAKATAEQANRQKTEFLSNVSHELRTPLNTILLLARLLSDDRQGLGERQRGHARSIAAAGNDLVSLIDDLLDLSRIEAGRIELHTHEARVDDIVEATAGAFRLVAADRDLSFEVALAPGTPDTLVTDERRVRQILRNLVSNALKFTDKGGVALRVGPSRGGVAFVVHDTGLGIPAADHERVFEPYLQLEGAPRRRQGTGLGLGIARDLARRLGGDLTLDSAPGQGTTLTLIVPLSPTRPLSSLVDVPSVDLQTVEPTAVGAVEMLQPAPLVRAPSPRAATVPRRGRLLVVEDDPRLRESVVALFEAHGLDTVGVDSRATALEALATGPWDAVVLDLGLGDGSAFELLDDVATNDRYAFPPVVVHTGRDLDRADRERLRPFVRGVVRKGSDDGDRLLDEVMLAIGSTVEHVPPVHPRPQRTPDGDREAGFAGRTVLVAEDDARNVAALRAVLESRDARLLVAHNGIEALRILDAETPVDLVLMDVMMPEMDGLEAMRRIRRDPERASLPIIALTSRAMIDDRNRCLAAGADDYMAKPVDLEKLLSLCRVWLTR